MRPHARHTALRPLLAVLVAALLASAGVAAAAPAAGDAAPRAQAGQQAKGTHAPASREAGTSRAAKRRIVCRVARRQARHSRKARLRVRRCRRIARRVAARREARIRRIASGSSLRGTMRGWSGFGAGSWPGARWRPYADSSPFNQVAAGAASHPDSARMVQKVLSWGLPGNLVAGAADTTSDYGHPTYYAQPSDPLFTLHATGTRNEIEGLRIPIPDAARPAAGGDGHMTVVTPDGWEYDFWEVRSKPAGGGTLTFSIGGRTRIDGDGLDGKGTASNFGNLAGVIRAQELAAGRIDHALFVVLRCTTGGTSFGHGTQPAPSRSQGAFVYPANHGGAICDDPDVPPMGARFHLEMTAAQIDALSVPAWKKTILRALATYGGYVGDTGGPGFGLQFESSTMYTAFGHADPLVDFAKQAGLKPYKGRYVFDLAHGVDWERHLRVTVPPAA